MLHTTLRQLRVFDAVARHLNFSRAAESLFLSQPAVSMQIKQLEQNIGLPLLEQVGRRLNLTEAGRELLKYSRNILQQVQEMDTVFNEMKGLEHGQLSIAVVSTANYFMPRLLAKFIRLHPKIHLSLSVANRDSVIRQLDENSADLAIMGLPPEGTDMVSKVFMPNPLVVIAAPDHPLAKLKRVQPRQLAKETFLLREKGSGTRGVVERFFAGHKLPLPAHMEMDTNEAIKQSVSAHIGIGIISRHGIEMELETKRLCILDAEGFPIVRNWNIVQRKNKRLSTAAQAFQRFLLDEAARLTEPTSGGKRGRARQ
jgi:DNA-binding transcriptional LysR family regulator